MKIRLKRDMREIACFVVGFGSGLTVALVDLKPFVATLSLFGLLIFTSHFVPDLVVVSFVAKKEGVGGEG